MSGLTSGNKCLTTRKAMAEKSSTSFIRVWRVRVWGKEEGWGGRKQQEGNE